MTNEELWQSVLAQVQLHISQANFATWFKNTEIVLQKKEKVVISVPNSFVKEWLKNKYNKLILKILHNINNQIKEIEYVVGKPKIKTSSKSSSTFKPPVTEEPQLEFPVFKIDKYTTLNPRYDFDSFVVGPFNELPHAAAIAVAKNPGVVYNPFFVYGPTGLGKTHLLQAIGNEIVKTKKRKKVKYIPTEKFASEVVSAIRNHDMESFKEKYRDVDVLIIDDVQFLAGKEKTQEEFFHIFNVLYENNKQVVLSSDRPPRAIKALAERLRSRFEGGMIADIGIPDLETRIAILKAKAQERNIELPNNVYEYIASIFQKNIRELEGALNRIVIYQKINNKTPDLETVKSLFKKVVSHSTPLITAKKIIKSVAEFYEINEKDLLSLSRRKEIVKPRQIAMYLLREELKTSFPTIGRKFNGKDHTTAIHSYKKIAKELTRNKKLEEEIQMLKEKILSS